MSGAAGTPSISRSSPISIGLGGAPFVGEDGNGESWILVIGDNREVSLLRTIEDTDDSPGAVETRSFGRMADATVIRVRHVSWQSGATTLGELRIDHEGLPGGSIAADKMHLRASEAAVLAAFDRISG